MNPLELRGPEFLLFYWVMIGVGLALATAWRRSVEGGVPPKVDTSDAYLMAYLRGGVDECLRVALFSLEDRGLLSVMGDSAKLKLPGSVGLVRRPLERALLEHFAEEKPLHSVFESFEIKSSADSVKQQLTRVELLPGPRLKLDRAMRYLLISGALLALGIAKLVVALSRGRGNLLFLFLSMAAALGLLALVVFRRRTVKGDRLLNDVQVLFSRLRTRASDLLPGGATNEAALVAAVFGLGMLPSAHFPNTYLFQKAGRPDTSDGGESSSCSSSSCGSSCGGGCGGGCGGCGS